MGNSKQHLPAFSSARRVAAAFGEHSLRIIVVFNCLEDTLGHDRYNSYFGANYKCYHWHEDRRWSMIASSRVGSINTEIDK